MPRASSRGHDKQRKPGAELRRGPTVRVEEATHTTLREISAETGLSIQELIARAVEEYRRHRVLELSNTAYARLRAESGVWQEEIEERALWDQTLVDLRDDE